MIQADSCDMWCVGAVIMACFEELLNKNDSPLELRRHIPSARLCSLAGRSRVSLKGNGFCRMKRSMRTAIPVCGSVPPGLREIPVSGAHSR